MSNGWLVHEHMYTQNDTKTNEYKISNDIQQAQSHCSCELLIQQLDTYKNSTHAFAACWMI